MNRLSLAGTQLSGEVPAELGNLANLEMLWLHDNQLSGEIPPALGRLTYLAMLWLHENQLSGTIPPELGNLANLFELRLGGSNQFTGCIPKALEDVSTNDLDKLGLPFCGDG